MYYSFPLICTTIPYYAYDYYPHFKKKKPMSLNNLPKVLLFIWSNWKPNHNQIHFCLVFYQLIILLLVSFLFLIQNKIIFLHFYHSFTINTLFKHLASAFFLLMQTHSCATIHHIPGDPVFQSFYKIQSLCYWLQMYTPNTGLFTEHQTEKCKGLLGISAV